MFTILQTLYKLGKITAADVWAKADENKITTEEAAKICGARP